MVRPRWVDLGDERVQRVVEREPALVAQLHHQRGGERLGVGRDQELVVRSGRRSRVVEVGAAPMPSCQTSPPSRTTPAKSTGDPAAALPVEGDAVQLGGWSRRERVTARP